MTNQEQPLVTYPVQAVVKQYDAMTGLVCEVLELRVFKQQALEYIRELEARLAAPSDDAPAAQEGLEG